MAEGGYKQVNLREADKPFCDVCKQKIDIQLKKCLECRECDLYLCDKCTLGHKDTKKFFNKKNIPLFLGWNANLKRFWKLQECVHCMRVMK